ncbi:MAG: HypC/HybG/HupF family hydrogenase formation chaperone [Calditrichaeota bacterium]|nr:MAG: HypC/HybG/HupF family hydrogenase formation chaperone [Calditrichota bacterium]MBL1206876.1 HypC/HybG/HupF family hydrogenase formation chaperone [Calditrichota bacterium]NOG46703.1 HypC/HybG/HupF family hydrogenase formation chaperone [Calditrichota bacterium]
MCLAIPGKVIEIYEEHGLKMGKLDYAGTVNSACLEYVPEIEIGQYAVIHAGFAINIIDEEEAQKTYDAWDEVIEAAEKEGADIFGMPLEEEKLKDRSEKGKESK